MDGIYSFLNLLLPFEWAEFDFMKNALLAVLMITPLFGLTGTMIVNNKMSFFSDALGHSALTGIAIGVMMGIDNYLISMLGFALLFAVAISGVMSSQTSSSDTIIGVFFRDRRGAGRGASFRQRRFFQVFQLPDRRYPGGQP